MSTDPKTPWALHKRRELASCLSDIDYEEWSTLSNRGVGRDDLTPDQLARLQRLEGIASRAYSKLLAEPVERTPENDLFLYAKQIGDRMRAKKLASSADPGTSEPTAS